MQTSSTALTDRPSHTAPSYRGRRRRDRDAGATRGRVVALDGLRGFALIGMLAWHAQLDWVRGGFARMTIFFVLSGYLATRSWERRRAEGFRAFWLRRTLRLLPMTLVGVALAVGVTVVAGSDTTRAALGGDVRAVLTYTSNWHFIDTGQSYGELFERQSAFQHYWSLSIEEQLFLVLPVLLAVGAFVSRRIRRPGWLVLAAGAVVTGIVNVAIHPSPDAIYFGTQTRLLEFLAGAALGTSAAQWSRAGPVARRWIHRGGQVSAVAIVLTLALVDRASSWLYAGGIYLFAVPVVAVVAAIELHEPALRWFLELRPLVWLGRAALSIYVLHWPMFVLLDDLAPSSVSTTTLALVKIPVGVAIGTVGYRLIERPMLDDTRRLLRHGLPVFRTRLVPMIGTAVVIAVVAFAVPTSEPVYAFNAAEDAFAARRADTIAATGPGDTTAAGATGPTVAAARPRVGVFGGSTALMNHLGLASWSDTTGEIDIRAGDARLGCGLLQHGERPQALDRTGDPVWYEVPDECAGWPDDWRAAARAEHIDIALVFSGVWEIADWRLPGRDTVTSVEDAGFRDRLAAALADGIAQLRAGGVSHVVLMTSPVVGGGQLPDAARLRALPADHAARTARFNQLLRDAAAADPGHVSVFDYAAVIEGLGADMARLVPDGVHPTWDGSAEIWGGPAGQQLLAHLAALAPAPADRPGTSGSGSPSRALGGAMTGQNGGGVVLVGRWSLWVAR